MILYLKATQYLPTKLTCKIINSANRKQGAIREVVAKIKMYKSNISVREIIISTYKNSVGTAFLFVNYLIESNIITDALNNMIYRIIAKLALQKKDIIFDMCSYSCVPTRFSSKDFTVDMAIRNIHEKYASYFIVMQFSTEKIEKNIYLSTQVY